ncbi:MAG: hypothetical protein M5R42_09535 [Rhodocyclaceae bacterium]|nr:hypothetical protein [Rhodocyclaceae bacterium]
MGLAVGRISSRNSRSAIPICSRLKFLDDVMRDVIESGEVLHERAAGADSDMGGVEFQQHSLARYLVNLLVDNAAWRERRRWSSRGQSGLSELVGRGQRRPHGHAVTNFHHDQAGRAAACPAAAIWCWMPPRC